MDDKFPIQKYPAHRVMKYRLYQLLTGQLITRRDVITAGAAGATGIAVDHLFGLGVNFAAGGKPSAAMKGVIPAPVIVHADKLKQKFNTLGKYIYPTPEKMGGGPHAVDFNTGKTMAWISYWN